MTEATLTIEDIPVTAEGQTAKLVKFVGQLDESNVDEKAKIIYQLLEEHPQNLLLLFDFEGLEYMNSKSIGYLTDWYGKISEGGGKITIAKAKSNILDILQVVGLTQLINCFPTLDEAKFSLLNTGGGEAEAAEPSPEEEAPISPQAQIPAKPAEPTEPAAPSTAPEGEEEPPIAK
jgi:anti-anti-sigma factor